MQDNEYDFSLSAEDAAAARGLIVVRPAPNQLQLDVDNKIQRTEVERRMSEILDLHGDEITIVENPSASGKEGCTHITITFKNLIFDDRERLLWQFALGDDPLRSYLNFKRWIEGTDDVSRLFEKP